MSDKINDKILVTWRDIRNIIDIFVNDFRNDHDDEYIQNTEIVAVAKGGLIPAQLIAYRLGIRKIHTIGIQTCKVDKIGERYDAPIYYQDVTSKLNGNILVIDDICDSGDTIQHIAKRLKELKVIDKIDKNYTSFTLYAKYNSEYGVTYYGETVPNYYWVVFPWDGLQ